jgi:ABC-type transporter Mla maintaining outer membrane lipid asymmetry ATPase subunit MlaF
MPDPGELLVAVTGVEKDYRSLRPLRVRELLLHENETLALVGFDQAMAEVLVNLIAGATLPDIGEVRTLGRLTSDITSGDDWMKALDRLGILSERAVLLDQMTVEQNLAIPLTLELFDLPADVRAAVIRLAEEVGLAPEQLKAFTSTLSPLDRLRLRLARALAVNPRVIMAEHPNASVPSGDHAAFAADLTRAASARRLGMLVLTADKTFASAVADRVLTLNPASGELTPSGAGWRRWFS